jgi:hypothetical protein
MTVLDVFRELFQHPWQMLIQRWNWKSALFSSILRGLIFLFANLAAGCRAATGAMLAEFLYRAATAGFYGALTQAFRCVEPVWMAGIAVMILLPLASHSLELAIHVLRGTPKIVTSLVTSVIFTWLSTLFNLYAMRRGVLLVDSGANSLRTDLRQVPRLILEFAIALPVAAWVRVTRGSVRRNVDGPQVSPAPEETDDASAGNIHTRHTPDRKCDSNSGTERILAPGAACVAADQGPSQG